MLGSFDMATGVGAQRSRTAPGRDKSDSMLDRRSARAAVAQFLSALEEVAEAVEPGTAWVSERGVLVVVGPNDVRAGFGVRSRLTRSAHLLGAIAAANQLDPCGHLWLAEGRDDRHWSLVWGATLPYAWLSPVALHRALFSCTAAAEDPTLKSRFAQFDGTSYWAPMVAQAGGLRAPALVLWEHLA